MSVTGRTSFVQLVLNLGGDPVPSLPYSPSLSSQVSTTNFLGGEPAHTKEAHQINATPDLLQNRLVTLLKSQLLRLKYFDGRPMHNINDISSALEGFVRH